MTGNIVVGALGGLALICMLLFAVAATVRAERAARRLDRDG